MEGCLIIPRDEEEKSEGIKISVDFEVLFKSFIDFVEEWGETPEENYIAHKCINDFIDFQEKKGKQ